ncbi:hypothetical protein OH76DRAFT_1410137 [Lentinus brumalis]|uniref:F-box domain-containing protein n=1 Tax=Lentinus brumalis TaxID=2498619 RepID=A0A371CT72_9APHY|nr:hypothetical protein OH76DRAFT_1410137 [Polyporus brumalis]
MNSNVSTRATTLDNPLPVSSLPRAVRARLEDSITGELQIMAASVVQGYETEIDQHEEKIRQLRDYTTRVQEICNSRVSINLLPQELLLRILRSVTEQLWLDRSAQIRLRQVCRLRCNVIDRSPRFWMDHLAPDIPTTLTRIRGYFHIVLAAFEKTKAVARLSFSSITDSSPPLHPCHRMRHASLPSGSTA